MNVKIFSRFLLMLVIVLTSLPLIADPGSSGSSTPSSNGSAVLRLQEKSPDIKRMPSRNRLEVVYENGMMTLLSDSYVGEFSMNFIGLESVFSLEISSISIGCPIMLVLPIGEYQVEAVSGDGIIFKGLLTIQ